MGSIQVGYSSVSESWRLYTDVEGGAKPNGFGWVPIVALCRRTDRSIFVFRQRHIPDVLFLEKGEYP
ncbi:MAG: hypothetical protein VX694_11365, partial [Planctomycetota bacterium]|nr:hypothetical protein [Planctomycetota bacterium]